MAGDRKRTPLCRNEGWPGTRGIGIEIEERYCEVAARRFDQGAFDFGAAA